MKNLNVVIVVAAAAASVASGCEDRIQGPCTPDRRLGLGILVVNDQTETHICNAVVTARDGAHSETLNQTSDARVSGCLHVGASERPGTYAVQAEAPGFLPSTARDVKVPVTADGCHVEEVIMTIRLMPTGAGPAIGGGRE
jgi:hypothetical protein